MTRSILWVIANDLLTSAGECLDEAGMQAPERRVVDLDQFIAPVELEGPCSDQLAVSVGALSTARSTSPGKRAGSVTWQCTFTLALHRCYTDPDALPDPVEVNERSKFALEEGWHLIRSMTYRWVNGTLTPNYDLRDVNVVWGGVKPIPARAFIRGWTMPITIDIEDLYDPTNPV